MYHGEIQIYQHELDRFLGIAERLKLEGLIGGEPEEDGKTENALDENIETIQEDFIVSRNENKLAKDVRVTEKPVVTVQSSDIKSLDELDQKVEDSYTKVGPGCYTCNYCVKSFKDRSHMKEHVEMHIEGLSFPCTMCDKILRSRHSLREHNRRKHFS